MPSLPPALPPAAYCDAGWHDREQKLLFRKLWQFVAFRSQLNTHNAFVTKKLAGIPVVVQNFSGTLQAFENICLHRQAPIQTEAQGVRPLACRYHGWSYGDDGHVNALPMEEFYQFPPEKRSGLCLRRFALTQIGQMVFINLSPDPVAIERQFSPELIADLTNLSNMFDATMLTARFERSFNWKLVFENLRDGIHPSFLHRGTLYRDVKFQPKPMPPDVLQAYIDGLDAPSNADPMHEAREFFSRGGPDTPMEKAPHEVWHDQVGRYGDQDWYYNWLLFPNLHIASATGGRSFIVEHYQPTGPATTAIDIYCMTAKRKHGDADMQAALQAQAAGAERVLDEDFTMLEQIQSVLSPEAPAASWGAFELRNHRVARWIGKVVDGRIRI